MNCKINVAINLNEVSKKRLKPINMFVVLYYIRLKLR